MTPAQMQILANALLPGDDAGLPMGSLVADVMAALARSTSPIKALIPVDFPAGTEPQALLTALEQAHPADFRDFVLSLLKPYYETAEVLEALGWSPAPPQPHGHPLAAMDEALTVELGKIAARRKLWR